MTALTYRQRRKLGLVRKHRPTVEAPIRKWVEAVYFGRHGTQDEIAKFLGCSQSTVHRIVSGTR